MTPSTYETLRARVTGLGHPWFVGTYNLNVIGLRTLAKPNTFDDMIVAAYEDQYGPKVEMFAATTDPGSYWLQSPMNVKGTAVLATGHHRGLWQPGLHGGPTGHPALVQVSPCAVWRDSDRDSVIDPDKRVTDVGMHGINLHRASASGTSMLVDRWSAGCQVVQAPAALARILELVERQRLAGRGSRVSYTLMES